MDTTYLVCAVLGAVLLTCEIAAGALGFGTDHDTDTGGGDLDHGTDTGDGDGHGHWFRNNRGNTPNGIPQSAEREEETRGAVRRLAALQATLGRCRFPS